LAAEASKPRSVRNWRAGAASGLISCSVWPGKKDPYPAGQAKAMDTLNANGAEIARFLAGANPNLPEPTLLSLLTGHVAHHATQIRQIMASDSKGEAATWDAMQKHMDTVADALAAGIAKQFPDQAH